MLSMTGASFVVIDGALKGGEETFTVSVLEGSYEYGLKKSRILGSLYSIPCNTEWSLRLVAVYNIAKGRFAYLVQSKVFAVSEQITAQIARTLVPFVSALVDHDHRLVTSQLYIGDGYVCLSVRLSVASVVKLLRSVVKAGGGYEVSSVAADIEDGQVRLRQ
ncbi:unnamed protein product [Gongylonema pulchrum]|uniref:LAGLIDADG_2 domain-containing protein n=1 Tax=Gongylonema pulchrum TaxID=637853 RepID=A0A183EUS2_9BILA|nr:unnamed protein product [Gongylonema pulchrum]